MNIKQNKFTKAKTKELSDYELAQKSANGDIASFEILYWKHHRRVYGVCLQMTKNVSEAEDVTQKVFLQLFKRSRIVCLPVYNS